MAKEIIHSDLLRAQQYAYQPCGLQIKNVEQEVESQEYSAASFEIGNLRVRFREGKITPTKIGQFVTLWKRINKGPITPYDAQDSVDFFVISVRSPQGRLGQFVFSKAVLCSKGIMSQGGKGGKLAIRVYPVWDKAENVQAKRTQAWQLNYFFEIDQQKPIDVLRIKKLFLL
jgi:hypothetical protein